ncbi:MAG: type II secretion system protein [Candidatus Moranbacteria bacterium]|nr:type II secretion system protein [Candidatus Moranbacteria bacterium]
MGVGRNSCHAKRRGFTLVEVIITTAIIGIVSAVSIVSMSGLKVKREVEGNARIVAAVIREAQNNAITGKNIRGATCTMNSNPAECAPCGFEISASGNSYIMTQSNADLSGGGTCSAYGGGQSVLLTNGVTISNQKVRFVVPRAEPKTSMDADLDSGSIDFVLSKGAVSIHVCVYPLGRVEERPIGSVDCN